MVCGGGFRVVGLGGVVLCEWPWQWLAGGVVVWLFLGFLVLGGCRYAVSWFGWS